MSFSTTPLLLFSPIYITDKPPYHYFASVGLSQERFTPQAVEAIGYDVVSSVDKGSWLTLCIGHPFSFLKAVSRFCYFPAQAAFFETKDCTLTGYSSCKQLGL